MDNNPFDQTVHYLVLTSLIFYNYFSIFKGELLPTHARSLGCGLLGIMDNLSMFVSTKMVPTWFELLGIHGTFFMYSSVIIFVALLSYFFMPETSGMSLEEIEEMYRGGPASNNSKQQNIPGQLGHYLRNSERVRTSSFSY